MHLTHWLGLRQTCKLFPANICRRNDTTRCSKKNEKKKRSKQHQINFTKELQHDFYVLNDSRIEQILVIGSSWVRGMPMAGEHEQESGRERGRHSVT